MPPPPVRVARRGSGTRQRRGGLRERQQRAVALLVAAGLGRLELFAHPLEDLLVNLPSTFVGPVLVCRDAHFFVFLAYLALRFNETIDAHSGFDLPLSPWRCAPLRWVHGGAERHDWHHSHQVGNFGGFIFWDRVMGTDRRWRESRRKQQQGAKPASS